MEKAAITREVAECLVREQFPQWAGRSVRPVEVDGWDNTSFRLGDDLLLRLPSADGYAAQVDKEQRWLPVLAPHLPLPIPQPVARGRPGCGYPRPWSVMRWLPGAPLSGCRVDATALAEDLAAFLRALRRVEATGGPTAGPQSAHRGGDLATYDDDVTRSLEALSGVADTAALGAVWERARRSRWTAAPVWIHGDVAPSNLLVSEGRLSAVIDFGQTAVGDPACDLVMAWTFFDDAGRRQFLDRNGLDADSTVRARGWALWKAGITVAAAMRDGTDADAEAQRWGWSRSPADVLALILRDS